MKSKYYPQPVRSCQQTAFSRPQLIVVIDTEEEFDWSTDFSRGNTSVQSIRELSKIQGIFDEYNICPVYVIDFPVASQPDGYLPLKEIFQDQRCLIGAHLHPWVNPPFEEEVTRYHSFPGNLSFRLEQEKLMRLGKCIEDHFQYTPNIYKAGRYGAGSNTAGILEFLGYECDLSVCPQMDWTSEGGPNYTNVSAWPYWFGKHRQLLELPLTAGFTGLLRKSGEKLYQKASAERLAAFYPIGILARLRLLDKIRLTPEGFTFSELCRLVKVLWAQGLNVFTLAFHSPSLQPGNTPYVRSSRDLETFLACCRKFFDFFFGELNGQSTTPLELKKMLLNYNRRFP